MTAFCKLSTCREPAVRQVISARPEHARVQVFCSMHANSFSRSPEGRRVFAAAAEHRLTQPMLVAALSDFRTRVEREGDSEWAVNRRRR